MLTVSKIKLCEHNVVSHQNLLGENLKSILICKYLTEPLFNREGHTEIQKKKLLKLLQAERGSQNIQPQVCFPPAGSF